MKQSTTYTVRYRRKREGRTNYLKRLNLLKSSRPRIVIRMSNNNIVIQLVEYKQNGDNVKLSSSSLELRKLGWKYHTGNIASSYLLGLLFGKRLQQNKVSQGVLDIGSHVSVAGSRIYATAQGLIDSGIDVPVSKEILPTQDRVSGKHISEYAKYLKNKDVERYNKQFSNYVKNNLDPVKICDDFKQMKDKILKA